MQKEGNIHGIAMIVMNVKKGEGKLIVKRMSLPSLCKVDKRSKKRLKMTDST